MLRMVKLIRRAGLRLLLCVAYKYGENKQTKMYGKKKEIGFLFVAFIYSISIE